MPARIDNVSDPGLAAELLLARRGQAFFARKLNELRDEEFARASTVPGWTRAHVIAHAGYHARAIARLVEGARTGSPTPMFDSPDQQREEIEFGATLPTEALRNLAAHAAVHLNVEWRDLPEDAWSTSVDLGGRVVPVSATVGERAREVWIRAIQLDNGASAADLPVEVRERILRGTDLRSIPTLKELPCS